jgi:hypothetical protein
VSYHCPAAKKRSAPAKRSELAKLLGPDKKADSGAYPESYQRWIDSSMSRWERMISLSFFESCKNLQICNETLAAIGLPGLDASIRLTPFVG